MQQARNPDSRFLRLLALLSVGGAVAGCGGDEGGPIGGGGVPPPKAPTCMAAGGTATVAAPTLLRQLADRYQEGWLGSPAVADLDGDGRKEIVAAREGVVIAWEPDGSERFRFDSGGGRVWAGVVVADLEGDGSMEVAFAARDKVFLLDAKGAVRPGFPVTWQDEMRALGAADLDGDGRLELVASVGRSRPGDVVNAWRSDGRQQPGFPPNGSGTSGCDDSKARCYLAGCYDQNLALGDLDGDSKADLVAPHDNAYASLVRGSGVEFDAAPGFSSTKAAGVRYLHALAEARQGYAADEEHALQAHFTNTAPAIADLDGDGRREVILLGSVQNAAQSDLLKGVALWVVGSDASRRPGWEEPLHFPDYLAGLWDFDSDNLVAATNQVAIADLNAEVAGKEMIFAGFDGRVHAVSAARQELWAVRYTNSDHVLTGGVAIGDLSGDGIVEAVFATYTSSAGEGRLFVLDAGGNVLHALPLPGHGSMAVPTLADVDGDGTVEIVVSLKEADDKVESLRVYTVPGSSATCLPWPTGHGNFARSGLLP